MVSVSERAASGRSARKDASRSSQARFERPPERSDVVALLGAQDRNRVAELVPLRYHRMLTSPFAFFRGAAAVMASDLATAPTSGLQVQCCGDAHLSNFGLFASPERNLVFDINDFDETHPGPWEWDVKRLAASLMIAAEDIGVSGELADAAVQRSVARYRLAMRDFASQGNLDVWYARLDADEALEVLRSHLGASAVKKSERVLAKARTRDSMSAAAKLTEMSDEGLRFVADPPLIVPAEEVAASGDRGQVLDQLRGLAASYRATLSVSSQALLGEYELVDFARKVVGVGSVGTRTWIALLLGRDESDPLILQLKEAGESVLAPYVKAGEPRNPGERVFVGQRLMQASGDILLGWVRTDTGPEGVPGHYYGRQLRDWKLSATIERMDGGDLAAYGELCGWTLARAHARSGDRVAIAAYLGAGDGFERSLVKFAQAYRDQNDQDHRALERAVKEGRVTASAET